MLCYLPDTAGKKLHGPTHYKIGVAFGQRTCVLYSVVMTRQSNTPILQFNSPCNEFTSFWSMFVYNTHVGGMHNVSSYLYNISV